MIILPRTYATVPKLFTRLGFVEAGTLKDWIRTPDGYSDVCIMQLI